MGDVASVRAARRRARRWVLTRYPLLASQDGSTHQSTELAVRPKLPQNKRDYLPSFSARRNITSIAPHLSRYLTNPFYRKESGIKL